MLFRRICRFYAYLLSIYYVLISCYELGTQKWGMVLLPRLPRLPGKVGKLEERVTLMGTSSFLMAQKTKGLSVGEAAH